MLENTSNQPARREDDPHGERERHSALGNALPEAKRDAPIPLGNAGTPGVGAMPSTPLLRVRTSSGVCARISSVTPVSLWAPLCERTTVAESCVESGRAVTHRRRYVALPGPISPEIWDGTDRLPSRLGTHEDHDRTDESNSTGKQRREERLQARKQTHPVTIFDTFTNVSNG